MKKFLLGTTALVGFAASTAAVAGGSHYAAPAATGTAAQAGGLTVMIGGNIDSQIAITDQENTARTAATNEEINDADFATDAEIHFTVAGSAEDFDYGAVIELNTNIDGDPDGDSGDASNGFGEADKAYIFVESDNFGRVEFGGNEGASNSMEIDASNIARATGGIDGDFDHYADLNGNGAGAGANTAVDVRPNLVLADADATAADAQKVTYYTPKFSGLQLGVSYTPDTGNLGTANNLSGSQNNSDIENAFAAGISFDTDLDGIGLAIAAVGEQGDYENSSAAGDNDEYTGYSVGAQIDIEGFSLAGNYYNTEAETVGGGTANDLETEGYTIGAAFVNGPYGISLTYLESETENGTGSTDEFENIVVGADYLLAPGFTPYIEAAFFEDENNGALATSANNNEGSVVLLGAELSF